MPKHIKRLALLIVVFGAAALGAKAYFTPGSFYEFGHYRGDSVAEIASLTPSYQTPKACRECHAIRLAEWNGGHHKGVICEVCHGAAPGHPKERTVSIPEDTVRLCTQCHEKMPGRPDSIRQVDPAQHHASATQCISCHNPHAPRLEAAAYRPSFNRKSAEANAAVCAGCHGARGAAVNEAWPNLAGQNAAYIARAVGSFKTGARKDATMSPMAATVADEDVPALAAYFSTMACAAPAGSRGAAGGAKVRELARQCSACHGAAGRPQNPAWPSLAGQNATYLSTAMTAFRDGQRTSPYMSPVARALSDADIAALASHYSAMACATASR